MTSLGLKAGSVAAAVGAAAIAVLKEIPAPDGMWPVTVGGWLALILGTLSILGVTRLLAWPMTTAQLRKALGEEDTRCKLRAIIEEDWKLDIARRGAWMEQARKDIDVNQDRIAFLETAITQQGHSLRQMPDLVATLGRIEVQLEMQTEAIRGFSTKAERIDKLEGRMDARDRWDDVERRHHER